MTTTKRARIEQAQIPEEKEKEPKLKCHEMRLTFQHLPTSELIRFISNQPNHPLGKFWSQELKFVIEKRLPFSIKANDTSSGGGTPSDHVIFDCNDSRVAEIKHPKQFYLSPICELIESAELPAVALYARLPVQFVLPMPDVLSTLTNLDTLVLSAYNVTCYNARDPVNLHAALNPEVMFRIKSLTLPHLYCYGDLKKPLIQITSRATSLKKLCVPCVDLSLLAALSTDLSGQYSSLESLSIKYLDAQPVQPLLEIITSRLSGLRELFLPIHAPIRQYLASFRALPSLATIGLTAPGVIGIREVEKQLAVDENDAPVVSVSELLIAGWSPFGKETLVWLSMLSKFPNVRTFGADFGNVIDFASAVCVSGVFKHLQSLKLFGSASFRRDALLQFIHANIDRLPSCVDLSQWWTTRPTKVECDFLVDLCKILQGGRITSLVFKDFVHKDAVRCLRENFALTKQDKSTPQAEVGKIFAWIDERSIDERRSQSRAVGWPEAVSDFTDFRIEARKTLGPLKGLPFKVRISNWTEKRERLFAVQLY